MVGLMLDRLPTGGFSFVMATGILGTAFVSLGFSPVGAVLLGIALAALVLLLALTVIRLVTRTKDFAGDLRQPARAFGHFSVVASLDVVAALAAALGLRPVAIVATVIAIAVWAVLTYGLLPHLVFGSAVRPLSGAVDGGWLLWAVGTLSVAVALTAVAGTNPFWLLVAFAFWCVGLVLYVLLAGLLLHRLAGSASAPGVALPTSWIVMGATAIVTLAAARILAQPALPPLVDSARPFIVGLTFALWAWGTWCVPFLAYLGVKQVFLARVPLRYNTGLWSIVFPAGMYSAACIFFGRTTHATPLVIVGTGVAWVAAALWLATCAFAVVALFRAKPWLRSPSRRPRY